MKKRTTAIVLAAVLACTACPAGVQASEPPITVFHFFEKEGSGPPGAFWKAAKRFQNDYPDIDMDFEFVASTNYSEILNIMMAGNELPDIWLTKADLIPTLADEGLILPAGNYVQEDPDWLDKYAEDVFLDSTYKDTVWGVPYQIQSNCVVFYNESIFEECGIDGWPDNIQELMEDCEKIRAAGYTPIALGNKDQWPAPSTILNTLVYKYASRDWALSVVHNEGASFTDPEFIRALHCFKELSGYFNNDMNSITQDEMESMFYNRKAAIFFCGAWAVGAVIQNCPEDVLADTHVALMPAVEGESGTINDTAAGVGWNYVIRADLSGERLDAALAFIKTVTCGEYADDALKEGFFSAAKASKEAESAGGRHPLFEEYEKLADQINYCPVLDCVLPAEVGSGVFPVDTQKLLIGEITPEEMAADLQQIMEANY